MRACDASLPLWRWLLGYVRQHVLLARLPRDAELQSGDHRRSGLGALTSTNAGRPFAIRRCCCVRGVESLRSPFDGDAAAHKVRATCSAHGATSLPQVGAVLLSLAHKWDISLQFPLVVSKKSDLRNGSRVIQLSTHSSISGRTGSRTSKARESRLGVSA